MKDFKFLVRFALFSILLLLASLALSRTGKAQHKIAKFQGCNRGVFCLTFLDNNMIATGNNMGDIQIWQSRKKEAIVRFDRDVRGINVQHVVARGNSAFLSVRTGPAVEPPYPTPAVWVLHWNLKHKNWGKRTILPGRCICISEDGKFILQRNDFKRLLAKPKTKKASFDTRSATVYEVATKKKIMVLEDHNKGLTYAAAISKDNKLVATVSGDNWISIWDLKKKQKVRILNGRETVHKICFSPDGRSLFSCHHGQGLVHHLQKWDIDREKSLWRIKLPRDFTNSVKVSPDGQKVAVCCGVRVYFYAAGNGVPMLLGPLPGPAFAFSRDGRRFATGDMHGNIAIWEFAK